MGESTSAQRRNWATYECARDRMTQVAFGPDRIWVAPPTVDAWAALAAVLKAHAYVIRTPDTDSYNCRAIKGGNGRSLHSYGIALDINWESNPYKTTANKRAVKFSDKPTQRARAEDVRLGRADTDMTPAMIADVEAIKTRNGKQVFEWGGRWQTVKDTMHFEIDVRPDDLATGIDQSTVKGDGGPTEPQGPGGVIPDTAPLLKRGSRGDAVRALQMLLMVDGIFGPLTEQAVRIFQRQKGLGDDGIVGPETRQELAKLLGPVEPTKPAVVPDAVFHVQGKMSTFGGPDDTGVGLTEGLAIAPGLARMLNPDDYYLACRWDYSKTPKSFLQKAMADVVNPANGKSAKAKPVDWGPHESTGRVADLSPGLARDLGLKTDDICTVTIRKD